MAKLKVLELFAGIGACSKALTNLGIEHEIVDAVEIDKYAIAAFNAIHGTDFEPQDITEWDKNLECDLIMHGSPCQDFSIAGKQAGGDKNSGTRSSLMYETLRIVEKLKPKYVIWENVKNLLSQKHRHNFDAYLEAMRKLGYVNYYQVLNAKDYGVPQNRERVFTVSILGDNDFKFPPRRPLTKRLKDVLEDKVDEKYYLDDEKIASLLNSNYDQNKRFYDADGICPTISTMGGGQRQPKVLDPFIVASRGRNPKNPSDRTAGAPTIQRLEPKFDGTTNTLTSVQKDNYVVVDDTYRNREARVYNKVSPSLRSQRSGLKVIDGIRIRKLTPKECYRLMGFSDQDFDRASVILSNTQLYKQAGNSIVVPVLEAILKELIYE